MREILSASRRRAPPTGLRSDGARNERLSDEGRRRVERAGGECGKYCGKYYDENWEKLKADDGSTMLDTLNRVFSRPNWYMTSATRWIRTASMPIG